MSGLNLKSWDWCRLKVPNVCISPCTIRQILVPTEERRKEETEGVRARVGKRRTAGRKEEGMNEGGNGAGRHRASASGAGTASRETEKHPHKHHQNGTACFRTIHPVRSTGACESHGSIPSNLVLSHAHPPSLTHCRDLWPFFSLWLIFLLALSDSLSVSQLSHHPCHSLDFSFLNPSRSVAPFSGPLAAGWCFSQ